MTGEQSQRRNYLLIFFGLAAVLLAVDRITKMVAIDQLSDHAPVAFLPAFLDFALVYNSGGAFGLFEGGGWLFVAVAVVAVAVIIAYILRASWLNWPLVVVLAAIAAGALGNAYDRAVSGVVPDFIHTLFMEFPVFNFADCCLTVGEIALVIIVGLRWFAPGKSEPAIDELAIDEPASDEQREQLPGGDD